MDVRFEEREEMLIVTPAGPRLDAAVVAAFRAATADKVENRDTVVLDLSSVSFMDSSGLAALISILKRLKPGGTLRLAAPNDAVKLLLQITRLERIFPAFATLEQAVKGA